MFIIYFYLELIAIYYPFKKKLNSKLQPSVGNDFLHPLIVEYRREKYKKYLPVLIIYLYTVI